MTFLLQMFCSSLSSAGPVAGSVGGRQTAAMPRSFLPQAAVGGVPKRSGDHTPGRGSLPAAQTLFSFTCMFLQF